jgi:hypothetical protein
MSEDRLVKGFLEGNKCRTEICRQLFHNLTPLIDLLTPTWSDMSAWQHEWFAKNELHARQ